MSSVGPDTTATRQRSSRHLPLTLFWWAFGAYATVSILWLMLSISTLVWPSLLPGAMEAHHAGGTGIPEHAEDLVLSVGTLALGLFLVWLAPGNISARAFAVGLVGTAVGFSLTAHHLLEAVAPDASLRFSLTLVSLLHITFHVIAGVAYATALLLFPDDRLPPLSRAGSLILGLLLLGSLLILVIVGHEPAYFILYCGLAVLIAGVFSQWLKARRGPPEVRVLSRRLLYAFLFGLFIAACFTGAVWGLNGNKYLVDLHGSTFEDLVFSAIPPLLAGTGIVVFVAILRYGMWGVDHVQHKDRLYLPLFAGVMGLYIVATVVVHSLTEEFGPQDGTGLFLLSACVVGAGIVTLERPREHVQRLCKRLVYGAPMDPYPWLVDFSDSLAATTSVDAVLPSLAAVLARAMRVAEGSLAISTLAGSRRMFVWPPGASVHASDAIPLLEANQPIGELSIHKSNDQELSSDERALAADLGLEAALAIRTRLAEQVTRQGHVSAGSIHPVAPRRSPGTRRRTTDGDHHA
jgi:hypothetical protein